jgi:glycosyltransferase involved in cell wall biosynthesis
MRDRMAEYLRIPRREGPRRAARHQPDRLRRSDRRLSRVEVAEDRPFTIGYFARIAPEKGLHLLVDAFCRLREKSGGGTDAA